MESGIVKVSVKGLIEYSLRGGSIGFAYQGADALARARDGVVFHKKLQKKRESQALAGGWTYEREVSFSRSFTCSEIEISVKGRADGVLKKDGEVFIEEIKTTELPLGEIVENQIHMAQAKCYAYFYASENGLSQISVLISYVNTKTFEIKEYEHAFEADELKTFFEDILEIYAKWAAFIIKCRKIRDITAASLKFPYESYRKNQREMCAMVYRAIERKRLLFVSAPTGIGKTVSTLFPSVKSFPTGKTEKIFYLTAKTITRTAALSAVHLMENKGLAAKTLVITAKDKICFLDETECEANSCTYADGHFDRINEALGDILANENIISREVVSRYAKKHRVCPYEFSLDIALYSDIIICDYNYAFDPRVYLRRFFADTMESYIFLIDEAHNLVDRAREMYSAELKVSAVKSAAKKVGKRSGLQNLLKEIAEVICGFSEEITDEDYGTVLENPPRKLIALLRDYCAEADKWLAERKAGKKPASYEDVLELYFEFNHFLQIADIFDNSFVCYCEKEGREIRLRLFCVDPAGQLARMLENAAAAVFFSATLTPLDYFKRLLGAGETDYAVAMPSVFPRENLSIITISGVSAKYKDRVLYYGDIARYIYTGFTVKPGNYFAFFPSYAYMEGVYNIFCEKYPQINVFIQKPDMLEEERESFLREFSRCGGGMVCFAVLGGMFSEGVDLPGDKLIGTFIISVGLPKISFQRLLISNYFKNESTGFEYAYMYPGMNKVLQAGGRVIRSVADKGVVTLIDQRFAAFEYYSLFPAHWSGFKIAEGVASYKRILEDFWVSGG